MKSAMCLLQWSHGILAMESARAHAFQLQTEMLQWSHGILAMERQNRGKPMNRQELASMEPWHFSHGERSQGFSFGNLHGGFNGAMAF